MGRPNGSFDKEPRKSTRAAQWAAMRFHRRFTVTDVALAAEIEPKTVREFLRALVAAGIVRGCGRKCQGQSRQTVYEFRWDLGPAAPTEHKDGMHDPNTGQKFQWVNKQTATKEGK